MNFQTSSQSFWLANLELPPLPDSQDLPTSSDVVVIGGGLTGVSTAYWLSSLGIQTTLLERGNLSSGATGRNGGHVVIGPNQNFGESVQNVGLEETLALWAFTQQSTELMRQFVEDHNILCDLHFNQWVTLALTPEQASALQENYRLMTAHNLAIDLWNKAEVAKQTHSSVFQAALVEPQHAQTWPAKLVLGMAQVASQKGATICPATHVEAVERHSGGFTLQTSRGAIQTQSVVYATNAFTHHLLPNLKGIITPVRGQVIATEPVPRLWDFDWLANDGYEYAIQRPDGRIVFGGMRWRSPTREIGTEDATVVEPNVSKGLRGFLCEAFAPLRDAKIEYEWTGIMGYTPDENPLIGELPGQPGEFLAAGYTGHGMSIGFLAGKALAEMIAGQPQTPIPKAYRSDRGFASVAI
ncbi:MAG: FAD-binding oxidoreductase [Cyanobacteria bacterium Co-bin8]|nr:FAD-binding oxidoreductase [Cyanobacteria bacterium Co-bin8]